MHTVDIRLYRIFRQDLHLPEEKAQELVQTLEEAVEIRSEAKNTHMTEIIQRDIQSLRKDMQTEMQALRKDMQADMQSLRKDMQTEMQSLRKDMQTDIQSLRVHMDEKFASVDERFATKADLHSTRADLTRWMFIFWVGQVATTLGIIFFILKK